MRHVVVGTAGHIDHGKSTLVQALTGIDPDRLKEEKLRGITIDLGFAHDVRGDVTLAFVDVPGHERFVRNMLAGATGIDLLLLVVAADESVMPQTREHYDICRLLQVRAGAIALTKADLVDAETLELVTLEVRDLVAGSFLAEAPVVPVSARTGQGIEELRAVLLDLARRAPSRREDGPFRMPVDRVFSVKGFGTVVTGTVVSGRAAVDDDLEVWPSGRRTKVRGLQAHGSSVARVSAGQRAAINLAGVEVGDLARGDTLATPGTLLATRRLDASLELLPSGKPLKHGARVRFHQGTAEVLGRVAIAQLVHASGEESVPSAEIPAGARALARIRLETPVVLTRGDRFVIRAYSPAVTIGGGIVLDPQPARGATRSRAGQERFARLDIPAGADPGAPDLVDRAVLTFAEERAAQGLAAGALVSRAGLSPADATATISRLTRAGALTRIADLLVPTPVLDALSEALRAHLAEYHRANPLSDGVPREEARVRLFGRADPAVFDAVLQRLVERGALVARDRLALAAHRVSLSPEEERARQSIEAMFLAAGLRPPDLATLPAALDVPERAVKQALELLQRQRVLVRIETLWFHADALEQLKREVKALKREGARATVDVAAFKERYGVSRKFAIPLLEFLDRERVTRREGETRVVL